MAQSKTPKVSFLASAAPATSVGRVLFRTSEPARIRAAIAGGKVRASALRELRLTLQLTIEDVADVLGVSPRTIVRKEHDKEATLSPPEADRAYRLARIVDLAIELIGDRDKALAWMRTPNAYLGGETPVRMLDTEVGTDLVTESLSVIAYGGVS
jgi:putative toxin-antitoxin system antitoxin component (TIGR02293 family)